MQPYTRNWQNRMTPRFFVLYAFGITMARSRLPNHILNFYCTIIRFGTIHSREFKRQWPDLFDRLNPALVTQVLIAYNQAEQMGSGVVKIRTNRCQWSRCVSKRPSQSHSILLRTTDVFSLRIFILMSTQKLWCIYVWGLKSTNHTNVHDNAQQPQMAHYWRNTTWTYIFLTINRVMSPSWFRPLPHQPQGDPVIKHM